MKKRLFLFMSFLSIFTLLTLGCSKTNKEEKPTPTTPAGILKEAFEKEVKNEKDILSIANKLSSNESIEVDVEVQELKSGDYIPGFNTEITNFTKAVTIRPFIGSIPFVIYIFETEQPQELENALKSNADLAWNICTEADEFSSSIDGNIVFFVMAPIEF